MITNKMQTFLPYASFSESARVLDDRRLGKQRVEAFQIHKTISTGRKAWSNHPAVLMWVDYLPALSHYHNIMILEWIHRGFKNTMELFPYEEDKIIVYPKWLGNEEFHASHRSNLLRKDLIHYSQFDWKESNDLPCRWPVLSPNSTQYLLSEFPITTLEQRPPRRIYD